MYISIYYLYNIYLSYIYIYCIKGETHVQFGYDLVSGCILELTRNDLINMCCASGSGSCTGDYLIYIVCIYRMIYN